MDALANEIELAALMRAGLRGDASAHDMLLKRLSGHLRSYYRSRLARSGRGAGDAEDLVQECLIAIHTRRHTYDESKPFTPWVFAIARYKLVDMLRRTKSAAQNVPVDETQELMANDDHAAVESSFDLHKLLSKLPAKVRQAIQDVKLTGLSVNEVAAKSGMSESAVKVSVHRGLRALAALIQQGSGS